MPYTPTVWTNGVTALEKINMDHLETQYDEAVARIPKWRQFSNPDGFHGPPHTGAALGTLALTADILYGIPCLVARTITAVLIEINVTIGSAGDCRLGIYRAGATGQPGILVLDAGIVDTTAAAMKSIVIAQSLVPDLYYLAILAEVTPTISALTHAEIIDPIGGWAFDYSVCAGHARAAQAYGALPDPFPAWFMNSAENTPFITITR